MIRILVCTVALAIHAWAADATLTPEERAHAIKLLQDSRAEFLNAVENISEAQWTWKSAPDRWSVGETAEHILLAETQLFSQVTRALAAPANPDWEKQTAGKTAFLERVMVDRRNKATAPEAIRPQGLSKDEVIRRYKEERAKTIRFAQETQAALKEHTAEHSFKVFNTLNAYQWLIYIPLHNLRHDQQIAEVQAMPDYPKASAAHVQ